MHQAAKGVIMMERDPPTLKGLVLALSDMYLNVVSASYPGDLDDTRSSLADCPALLLFPREPDRSGSELVAVWRRYFRKIIRSILTSQRNGMVTAQTISPDTVVVSDRVKPKDLRHKIDVILSRPGEFPQEGCLINDH